MVSQAFFHNIKISLTKIFLYLKEIQAKEYVNAEGKNWHIEHFVCWSCDIRLADKKYVIDESRPYCYKCYESSIARVLFLT